jgi:hypothetical protein
MEIRFEQKEAAFGKQWLAPLACWRFNPRRSGYLLRSMDCYSAAMIPGSSAAEFAV